MYWVSVSQTGLVEVSFLLCVFAPLHRPQGFLLTLLLPLFLSSLLYDRLLRSVLSVKDEFYHRHIVQYNLFAPVFDLFRAITSVGNNIVSSAILEVSLLFHLFFTNN